MKPTGDRWDAMRKEVRRDKNNIEAWERLLAALKDAIDHSRVLGPTGSSPATLLDETYSDLLERFPNLVQQWKNYLVLRFQSQGVDASISILALAVERFPYSVELWKEYLTAMTTQDAKNVSGLRALFDKAIALVGYHFNSDPIWDMYIAFESENSGLESERVVRLCTQVFRIPLYKYAIYFEKFSEINKRTPLDQLCTPQEIGEYLKRFQKPSQSELTEAETSDIIDDYCLKTYTNLQQTVGDMWSYESQIESFDFTGSPLQKDRKVWFQYLDFAISHYHNRKDEVSYRVCLSLFERALAPNCADGDLWLKYVSFVHSAGFCGTNNSIRDIFGRAINTLPLSNTKVRESFLYYLMSINEPQAAQVTALEWMELFAGPGLYLKEQYLKSVELFLELTCETTHANFPDLLHEIITSCFGEERTHQFNTDCFEHIVRFHSLVNNDATCVVVHKYLAVLKKRGQNELIRALFNKHHRQEPLVRSTRFWSFFVAFEGVVMRDMVNLKNVLNCIRSSSQLSQTVVTALEDTVYDIASANLPEVIRHGIQDDLLLAYKHGNPSSLIIDHSARRRYAATNYAVQDMDKKDKNTEFEFLRLLRLHADHPGVFTDAQPTITNSIAIEEMDIFSASMPDLPTFRNVERSHSLRYPE